MYLAVVVRNAASLMVASPRIDCTCLVRIGRMFIASLNILQDRDIFAAKTETVFRFPPPWLLCLSARHCGIAMK